MFAGNALVKCGQAQMRLGNAEREFMQSTVNNFLQPLKNFLDGDMKTIMVNVFSIGIVTCYTHFRFLYETPNLVVVLALVNSQTHFNTICS